MIPKSPTAFTDGDGRQWECTVTVGALERCRDAGGFDPMKFVHSGELWRGVIDPIIIAELAWYSVEQAATQRGVGKAQFKDSLRGDTIIAVRDAWFNAFAAFLPSRMGDSLLADKAELEKVVNSRLSESPSSGGATSTGVPESSELSRST